MRTDILILLSSPITDRIGRREKQKKWEEDLKMDKTKNKMFFCIGAIAAIAVLAFAFAIAAAGSDGGVIDQKAEGVTVAASALTTSSISYQGRLTDRAGEPLSGTYTMTFRLYDVASGGTALDTDTHSVDVTEGLFNTEIDFDQEYFDGKGLWLGITVGIDPEMSPRQELRSVPYAQSLRPGAVINGSVSGSILEVNNDLSYGDGIRIGTTGDNSDGVTAHTLGDKSLGFRAHTSGDKSAGVFAETWGDESPGVGVLATGYKSTGVMVGTSGDESRGVHVETYGDQSGGVRADTYGDSSFGVSTITHSDLSFGVYAETYGNISDGVATTTYGRESPGVYAVTKGDASAGIWASSVKSDAIYANTDRSDHKYGVRTLDYMYAAQYDTGSSDIAEYFTVQEDPEPGTVMVIGEDSKLECTTTAYDTTVAGIVSTAPGVSLGTKEAGNAGEKLIAVAGRVPCKVDASYAPIKPGDLLTTSDTPGHAMKAQPVVIGEVEIYRPGTTLGKALEPLDSGTGVIEVLVTLQ